jgi:hypothetical protein
MEQDSQDCGPTLAETRLEAANAGSQQSAALG